MSRSLARRVWRTAPFLLAIMLATLTVGESRGQEPSRSEAYQWLDIALEATAREHDRNGPRPTIGSRMLGIVVTCMYDAWAAYDAKAVGTRLGGKLRRPAAERTDRNKAAAVGYATY